MDHPRPVLPSQRYSPAHDYSYDAGQQHELIPTARQPLGESTGNVQAHSFPTALSLCHQNQLSLSPPLHSIPTPPIVPTQALASTYGTSLRGPHSLHRDVGLRDSPMAHARGSKNPIYAYKHFADYRNKVMQKELEKEQPTWPLWLEDAFLDALLLIPQMGRKKFSSKTVLYGRNMLITEYLWTYHWLLHPPQSGERVPVGKERENFMCKEHRSCVKDKEHRACKKLPHPMYRGRKQVSSHIQVLKGFFATLVTFHFIFPSRRDVKEDDKRLMREDEETESFKNNRVLISIADGRLPGERPNYEYFARLLSADNDVFLRPKQCWIFVSSSQVSLKAKHVPTEDGSTRKQITGYAANGSRLNDAEYPHLKLNDSKDYKELPRSGDRPTVLLHEYTKTLSQKESASIKDIAHKWEVRFPDLMSKLTAAQEDTKPSDERTSRCVVGPCDTFQFDVVLDLHANSKFPAGSELNGMVELSISRPDLHNHTWRSTTTVVKPKELRMNEEEPELRDRNNAVDVHPIHRLGCGGLPGCDCAGRGSRDTICVPFPAASWANTFIRLAQHVNAENDRRQKLKKEDEDTKPPSSFSKTPTELLNQVAMYQEIWSVPNDMNGNPIEDAGDGSNKRNGNWTRRAVLLWTFSPVQEQRDDKGNSMANPPGTSWRFLTKRDPTSQYHQQRAYLNGSPQIINREDVTSPDPGYAHHVSAAMQENFSAAYDAGPSITLPGQQHAHLASNGMGGVGGVGGVGGLSQLNVNGLLEGFPHGLATPPPSATFAGGFGNNAATGGNHGGDLGHLNFLSGDPSDANTGSMGGMNSSHGSTTEDPFMSGLNGVVPGTNTGGSNYNDGDCLQGWSQGGLPDMDTSQWATGTSGYMDAARATATQVQHHDTSGTGIDGWNTNSTDQLRDVAQWAISSASSSASSLAGGGGPSATGGANTQEHITPDATATWHAGTASAAVPANDGNAETHSWAAANEAAVAANASLQVHDDGTRGRKRTLEESLDGAEDMMLQNQQAGDGGYHPMASMRKLSHPSSLSSSAAPSPLLHHQHQNQMQHHHSHQQQQHSQHHHQYHHGGAPAAVMGGDGSATPTFM